MPELPEVETIVRELKKKVLGRTFLNIWTDSPKIIKRPKRLELFKKEIKNEKIKNIWRRGKNIIFNLSGGGNLLIHQKLTGHLLLGKWKKEGKKWKSKLSGPTKDDPVNKFLHLIFWLDNGQMLALSDLRKFAKVELWEKGELGKSPDFKKLGPEPLKKDFTFNQFKSILIKKRGKIKKILMDQNVIAGIGNIYSDEILFNAKINPFRDISKLSEKDLKNIYQAIKIILPLSIKLKGESFSNFRTLSGEKGNFDQVRKVYGREDEKCSLCKTKIKRQKMGERSTHFCPKCQKY